MLSTADKAKIDDLRAISDGFSEPIEVYQLLKIKWDSGDKWYSARKVDEEAPSANFSNVECSLVVDDPVKVFLPTPLDASLGDDEMDITIFDPSGDFADTQHGNGDGTPVEVYIWIPAVDLFLQTWNGHLRTAEDATEFFWTGKVANGFRSFQLNAPRRAHYGSCQRAFLGNTTRQPNTAEGDCPYDRHVGGTYGNPSVTSCDRTSPNSCIARGVEKEWHLSHHSTVITVLNGQTQGPQLVSIARGNESNLKEPVRVIVGRRRVKDMPVLNYRRDYNNNHPDLGFFDAIYEVCEGPIQAMYDCKVNGAGTNALQFAYRLGDPLQSVLSPALSAHAYSSTAIFRFNKQCNPANIGPESARGEAIVEGLDDIRVYTDATTYTTGYSNNRAWFIARLLTSRRWGYGASWDQIDKLAFIECGIWTDGYTSFITEEGIEYLGYRAKLDAELTGRSLQQQIDDICSAGRLSRPFRVNGQWAMKPLRALGLIEENTLPVFTDYGDNRNIVCEKRNNVPVSTLKRTVMSDIELPNRVVVTYHDAANDWAETVAPPAEDIPQQFKAGAAMGDDSRRVVEKKITALGITSESAAVKLAHWVLRFGEFADGGMRNNLQISFKAWFLDAIGLTPNDYIKVDSVQLQRYGFSIFRIQTIKPNNDLTYQITAQAWNNTEIETFETDETPPIGGGDDDGGGGDHDGGDICPLNFGTVTAEFGLLNVPIDPC